MVHLIAKGGDESLGPDMVEARYAAVRVLAGATKPALEPLAKSLLRVVKAKVCNDPSASSEVQKAENCMQGGNYSKGLGILIGVVKAKAVENKVWQIVMRRPRLSRTRCGR
jgi:hypothetical protein